MKDIILKNWEEFETEYQEIHKNNLSKINDADYYISDIVFRGQADSTWKLETTLERFTEKSYSIESYNNLLQIIKNKVESFTKKTWEFKVYSTKEKKSFWMPPPNYEFMAYLRHCSFPSPFLDWTHSPYIAAYFAFNKTEEEEKKFVSIYCFQEWSESGKEHSGNEPIIVGIGSNQKTHKRHYIHQSEYTICKERVKDEYCYCSHENAFSLEKEDQDILSRYLIPKSEKKKVLDRLDKMNINSCTLFETEEALMDVLARHEIKKKL